MAPAGKKFQPRGTGAGRGPSLHRSPMPLKRCEWCRKVIERQRGEKSKVFKVRRFCDRKCMAQAREMEKKIRGHVNQDVNK